MDREVIAVVVPELWPEAADLTAPQLPTPVRTPSRKRGYPTAKFYIACCRCLQRPLGGRVAGPPSFLPFSREWASAPRERDAPSALAAVAALCGTTPATTVRLARALFARVELDVRIGRAGVRAACAREVVRPSEVIRDNQRQYALRRSQ